MADTTPPNSVPAPHVRTLDGRAGTPKKLSSNSSLADLAKLIIRREDEKIENLRPRDIQIARRRNKKGIITPEWLLSKSQQAYRRKRQREVYEQIRAQHEDDLRRRGKGA